MTAGRLINETHRIRRRLLARPVILGAILLIFSGAIFIADTATDREIAVSVLYVVVILISVLSEQPRLIGRVGAACGILTILSFFLSGSGGVLPGFVNSMLSLVAIGATTMLAIKIEAAALARRQASADLAHMSRALIVGEFATAVAHEISQPLAAIVANSHAAVNWFSQSPPRDDEARRAIDRVARDADRAATVVAQVRHLMRRLPPSQNSISLNDTITETASLLSDQLRQHRITLRVDLTSGLSFVKGDHVQLQQVLLNLMINAIEAMLPGDRTTRDLTIRSSQRGRQVSISVQDCGVGLMPDTADRIFETFFTTKPTGMGVGLSISRSIIEAHGGTLDVGPHPLIGALFGFTLPAHTTATT